MKRCLTFAAWCGSLTVAAILSAQTSPRMTLPTGGITPPVMSPTQPALNPAQPTTTPAKTAATLPSPVNGATAAPATGTGVSAPAKPVLVAAQPTFAPTSKPSEEKPSTTPATATPAATVPVSKPMPADLPEWRFAEKPVLPPVSTAPGRYERTALQQSDNPAANRIRDCLLKASAEVQLPAQEAGVLAELLAFEGQEVKENQPLGRVDDSQPRVQKKAAEAERAVSIEKSKSTINERYAQKASDVAKQEHQKALDSNRIAPGSVSAVEVMRLFLTWEKGTLEFERAQEERKIETLTVAAKDVDVLAADDAIRRRQLISPINGVVVELTPKVGEWLKPGDPVLKIVNMEVLKIEGYVNIKHFRQDELQNRTVIAEVDMGTKVPLNVPGKIAFVNPVVEPGGEYRIKVEIQNRKNPQTGEWILKPGLSAELVLSNVAGNP